MRPPACALAHNGLGAVYIRTGRGDEARATLKQGLEEPRLAAIYARKA